MIIEISADMVVWYIAVMLTVISILLFFVLMALRILAMVVQSEISALRKKVPSFGGKAEGGAGGGLLEVGANLLGGLMGGGK